MPHANAESKTNAAPDSARRSSATPDGVSEGIRMDGLDRLSMMADASPQAARMNAISRMADASPAVARTDVISRMSDGSTPTPAPAGGAGAGGGPSVNVSIEQELLLLQGELSTGAKLKGFFGKESSFSEMLTIVQQYSKAATPEAKDALKPKVIATGRKWLSRHQDASDPNDLRKKNSIERIVAALEKQGSRVELASMDDKVTAGAKLNSVFGDPSSFQLVQTAFDEYQRVAHGSVAGMAEFYDIFTKGLETKNRIDTWKSKHGSSKDAGDQEKLRILNLMEQNLGKMEATLRMPPYFTARARGVAISSWSKGVFTVEEVTVDVQTAYGVATGSMTNVGISRSAFSFSNLSLSLAGEIQIVEGFKVTSPSLLLSTSGDSYAIRAGGKVSLEAPSGGVVNSLSASGTISAGYDFSSGELLGPTIEGGSLKAKFFDVLDLTVEALDYADGRFTAASGSLDITALDKTITTTVTEISYSKPEGFGFKDVTVKSSDTFEPIPGFTVAGPELTLSKTADGWDLSGAGDLGVSTGGDAFQITQIGARVSLTYGIREKAVKSFEASNGTLDMTIFNSLQLELKNFGFSKGVFSAAEGGLKLKLLGKSIDGSMTGLTYSKEAGLDFTDASLGLEGTVEPAPGFTIANPNLKLTKSGDAWDLTGSGALGFTFGNENFKIDKLDAQVSLTYGIREAAVKDFKASKGVLDMTIFKALTLNISDFSYADGTVSAASAGVSLNILGNPAKGTMNTITYSKDGGLDFADANFGVTGIVEPVPGFTVENPTLALAKNGESWDLTGSGTLGLTFGNERFRIDKVGADMTLTYGIQEGAVKDFKLTKGVLDMTVFNALTLNITNFSYADGIISAASAGVSLNILGKPATGTMNTITYSKDGGFDFADANFGVTGIVEPVPGFTVENPTLALAKNGESWDLTGSGTLGLTFGNERFRIDKVGAEVSLTYGIQEGAVKDFKLTKGVLDMTVFNALTLNITNFSYADGIISAASAGIDLNILGMPVTGTMNTISYSKDGGFDFADATLQGAGIVEPAPGFTVENPTLKLAKNGEAWDLTGSGTLGLTFGNEQFRIDKVGADVSLTYGMQEGAFKDFSLTKGELDMTVFNSLQLVIRNFSYADGTISAASAGINLNILGTKVDGSMTNITYDAAQGLQFSDATLGASGTFEPVPGFTVSDPTLTLLKEDGGWKVAGEGGLAFKSSLGEIVNLKSAAGKVHLLYSVKDNTLESASVDEGQIDLTLFNIVNLVGSGISFDSATGVLTIGSASVSVGVPAEAFGAASLGGTAKNLRISKDTFNWESIEIGMPGAIQMGGFTFQPPSGLLAKDGNSFIVAMRNAKGSFNVGDYLTVEGGGSIEWAPHLNNGMPRITEGALSASTGEIDIFKTFIPFFAQNGLDFSTGFTVPFAAGPVPMEAGFTIGGHANAKATITVDMAYSNDTFKAKGNLSVSPELGLYIKLNVGVGSRFIAYVGAYVKGSLDAALEGNVGFEAEASQQSSGKYGMDSFDVTYGIGANLSANLAVGGEVKALYFFEKELYEVSIRKWQLGKSEMSGRYDLLGGTNLEDKRSKVFSQLGAEGASAASLGIPQPPNTIQHKAYRQALERLSSAIDGSLLGADDQADSKGEEAIAKHKAKMSGNFERLITRFTEKQTDLQGKRDRNTERLRVYEATHAEWLASQEKKKEGASKKKLPGIGFGGSGATLTTFVHFQSKEWYEKKIVQGTAKYEAAHLDKTQRLEKIIEELDVLDTELQTAQAILSNMEGLFKKDGNITLDGIIDTVLQKKAALQEAAAQGEAAPEVAEEVFVFEDSEVKVS